MVVVFSCQWSNLMLSALVCLDSHSNEFRFKQIVGKALCNNLSQTIKSMTII